MFVFAYNTDGKLILVCALEDLLLCVLSLNRGNLNLNHLAAFSKLESLPQFTET